MSWREARPMTEAGRGVCGDANGWLVGGFGGDICVRSRAGSVRVGFVYLRLVDAEY